jgi:hypothetical protein
VCHILSGLYRLEISPGLQYCFAKINKSCFCRKHLCCLFNYFFLYVLIGVIWPQFKQLPDDSLYSRNMSSNWIINTTWLLQEIVIKSVVLDWLLLLFYYIRTRNGMEHQKVKVCNCLILFLPTVVLSIEEHLLYKSTANFWTHCIIKHKSYSVPSPTCILCQGMYPLTHFSRTRCQWII